MRKLIDDSVGAGAETFRGIAENFEKLGVVVAFQGIFGSDVDKTDEGLAKQFAAVDADGSGKISTQELRAHIYKVYGKGLDEKILVAMMAAADTNKDGEVSLDEFKAIMRLAPDKPQSP